MTDITKKSLTQIVKAIKTKEVSSTEVTSAFIKNIEKSEKLNAFITTCLDQALNKAKNLIKNKN